MAPSKSKSRDPDYLNKPSPQPDILMDQNDNYDNGYDYGDIPDIDYNQQPKQDDDKKLELDDLIPFNNSVPQNNSKKSVSRSDDIQPVKINRRVSHSTSEASSGVKRQPFRPTKQAKPPR